MPKTKTHRGAAKRFKLTKSGKIKRAKANRAHILTKKKRVRKRRLRETGLVDKRDEKKIRRLLKV